MYSPSLNQDSCVHDICVVVFLVFKTLRTIKSTSAEEYNVSNKYSCTFFGLTHNNVSLTAFYL